MFLSQRRTTFVLATLLTSLVALSGCGGDSGSERTRNAALDTRTCAEGGQCKVGDTGPGGGVVFYDGGFDREWGRYLEAAPLNWGDSLPPYLKISNYPFLNGEMAGVFHPGDFSATAPWPLPNNELGSGKSAWARVKDYRCNFCVMDILAEYNKDLENGWYVPNQNEMRELINSNVRSLPRERYWTSTPSTGDPNRLITARKTSRGLEFPSMFQSSTWTFVPIRAFSSTPVAEVAAPTTTSTLPPMTTTPLPTTTSVAVTSTTASLPPQVLKAPTNVRVTFNGDEMNVSFDVPRDGLEPQYNYLKIDWSSASNELLLDRNLTLVSISIPPYFRGTQARVSVGSYTNSTQPAQTADAGAITVDIPVREPAAAPPPSVLPDKEREVSISISVLDNPIINLPEEEVPTEINRDEFVESVESQLPELTVTKVEVQVVTPSADDAPKFVEITQSDSTNFVIPADATQVNVRVTGSQGEVVQHSKLIVRVNDEGVVVAPTNISQPTDTTVKPSEGESSDTTVVSTPGDESSDDSSGSNPLVWLFIALVALLLAAFGVRQLRR
ncbi:unannotated protein [freshwater metagenome]|uniref:Unannotated protein n=1 Tax=freshwater metagenome TaxID=449393 RepID=A0A6J6KJ62_9ZZZZ